MPESQLKQRVGCKDLGKGLPLRILTADEALFSPAKRNCDLVPRRALHGEGQEPREPTKDVQMGRRARGRVISGRLKAHVPDQLGRRDAGGAPRLKQDSIQYEMVGYLSVDCFSCTARSCAYRLGADAGEDVKTSTASVTESHGQARGGRAHGNGPCQLPVQNAGRVFWPPANSGDDANGT